MKPTKERRKYGSRIFKEKQLLLYRVNLVVLLILVLGALNHSCLPKTWGMKLNLLLPQLEEGYAMFAGFEPVVRTHYIYSGDLDLPELNAKFAATDNTVNRSTLVVWREMAADFKHISEISPGWGPLYDKARAELDWLLVPDVRRHHCETFKGEYKGQLFVEKYTSTQDGQVYFKQIACP